jgi:LisH domain-containing protein ARMC9
MITNLSSESIQVRTCVNGTLYSLLKRKKIKSEARSLGLEKLLTLQLTNPNEQMKKQIQYILEELNSEEEHEEKTDEEFEEDTDTNEEEVFDEEYVSQYNLNFFLLTK